MKFIQDLCRVRNDPGFQFSEPTKKETKTKNTGQIRSRKTDVKPSKSTGQRKSCFLEHRVESNHNIKAVVSFVPFLSVQGKSFSRKMEFALDVVIPKNT